MSYESGWFKTANDSRDVYICFLEPKEPEDDDHLQEVDFWSAGFVMQISVYKNGKYQLSIKHRDSSSRFFSRTFPKHRFLSVKEAQKFLQQTLKKVLLSHLGELENQADEMEKVQH